MASTARSSLLAGGIGLLLLLLFVLGVAFRGARSPAVARPDGPLLPSESLESLRERLAEEVQARESLEAEVVALREQMWALQMAWIQSAEARRSQAAGAEGEAAETLAAASAPGPPPRRAARAVKPSFDVSSLVDAGVPERRATELRGHWEELVLDRLELTDLASREGWAGGARHRAELQALDDELRASLGEREYDEYLFASRAPNQIVVQDIVARSSAASAGMQAGDAIIRYDGVRVFETGDLEAASRRGRRGQAVAVEVLRDGEMLQLSIPRGPFGAFVTNESRPPAQ